MTFPLINSGAQLSPTSSNAASSSSSLPAALVLDPDAVLRRASSIAGCQFVPVVVPASQGAAAQPSSSIFPGVSVRRATFQSNKSLSSSNSSGSNQSASNSDANPNNPKVLSFIVNTVTSPGGEDGGASSAAYDLARITIFVETGTVCTSRVAPFDGKVRHVFRRNVSTLDAIERLLKFPPSLTPVDHTIVGLSDEDDEASEEDDEDDDQENDENQGDGNGVVMVKDPLRVLQAELELADVGVAILEGEKSKLEHHLQSLVEQQSQSQAPLPQPQSPPNPVLASGGAAATTTTTLTPPPKATPTPAPTTALQVAAATIGTTSTAKTAKAVPPSAMIAQQKDTTLYGVAAPPAAKAPPAVGWNPQPSRVPAQPPAQQQPASPAASLASTTTNSNAAVVITKDIGMEFQFSLSASSMKHVDQCMSDITGMNKLIKGVATSGRGTVFLYGNGGVAYTPNIPRPLHHKLSQLRSNTKMSSRPSYVSLGSKDRFYCAFHDGTYCLKGPKSLEKELKRCFAATVSAAALPSMLHPPVSHMPVSVAFGSTWESWFVVFPDGSWKFQGKIPNDLSHKLASRKDRGDLVRVTLGPSGEWFVKARNGRMWWGGLTDAADASIQRLLKDHELCFLDFGEDGSYFVSYD